MKNSNLKHRYLYCLYNLFLKPFAFVGTFAPKAVACFRTRATGRNLEKPILEYPESCGWTRNWRNQSYISCLLSSKGVRIPNDRLTTRFNSTRRNSFVESRRVAWCEPVCDATQRNRTVLLWCVAARRLLWTRLHAHASRSMCMHLWVAASTPSAFFTHARRAWSTSSAVALLLLPRVECYYHTGTSLIRITWVRVYWYGRLSLCPMIRQIAMMSRLPLARGSHDEAVHWLMLL